MIADLNGVINPLNRTKMTTINVIKSSFCVDDTNYYEGFTAGETWNGWACPMFTKETTQKILTEMFDRGDLVEWSFDEKSDTFHYMFNDGNEEHEAVNSFDVYFAGQKMHVYGLGAYAWVWFDNKWNALNA
jgi:hypothetical protein